MITRRFVGRLALATSLLSVPSLSAFALPAGPGEQCSDMFMSLEMFQAEMKVQSDFKGLKAAPFDGFKALDNYKFLVGREPAFAQLFPEREVIRILATEEMPYFQRGLAKLMRELVSLVGDSNTAPSTLLNGVLSANLINQVPRSSIADRIAKFEKGEAPIERILGDNTQQETAALFHGGDPLHPTPESLIGQYLKETGASSIVRSFNKIVVKPGGGYYEQGEAPQGEQRLVVAVSAATFPIFQKFFFREDMLSVFAHAQVVQNGKVVSYSTAYSDLRSMSATSILPALILKTTEAQRTEFFLNLIANRGGGGWSQEAMVPWKVKDFCSAIGGYETCTHWIGNMPIGDKRVEEYAFPGAVDNYAQNPLPAGIERANMMHPRIAKLSPHAGTMDPRLNKLFQAPGYQQLSDVVGQSQTNVRGEWANPGWLITSLIGPTSNLYVPVVFVFADDAKAPIDPKFVPKYEQPL